MRYVRFKKVVKKIVDENVTDIAVIKDLVASVAEKELDCSIQVGSDPYFR